LSDNALVGENSYLEVSYVHGNSVIGNNCIISYVDIYNKNIPSDVILHGLKQRDGKFVVRIWGIEDNPKDTLDNDCKLFGVSLTSFLTDYGISEDVLWGNEEHSIWNAKLYPVCDTIDEAVTAAINLYNIIKNKGDINSWITSERKSLQSGFCDADPVAIIDWDNRMQELVCMDKLSNLIDSREVCTKSQNIINTKSLSKIQKEWLNNTIDNTDYSRALRLHYYLGNALNSQEGEAHISECFKIIQNTILDSSINNLKFNDNCKIIIDKHTVKLPLRVNWGGGWSDTPPYCNENGGTVLNSAILLNGEMPVEVTLEKIAEHKIIFSSKDMDVYGEFDNLKELQNTGDPYDPFALQKAALIACGIIPNIGGNLEEIFMRIGGGFKLNSEVTNVPKGSGLGTSSILSGACVKAIFEFMGIEYTEADLYSHVLCMEQIMATGGGWQDQVGGLSEGIKYITTMPGIQQNIKVKHIDSSEETRKELNERFVLIYTGQRRLARNLLRDVVGRYIGNEPDSIYALNEIQRVAALMKFELERGHIDDFAELMDYHWSLSKMIDEGSTNTLIDQIYESIDDLICGRLVSGAGGGGFLQAILKKGVSKTDVHNRLKEVFQDADVDVWNAELI